METSVTPVTTDRALKFLLRRCHSCMDRWTERLMDRKKKDKRKGEMEGKTEDEERK